MSDGTAIAGPDGGLRCPWALSTEDYVAYHDEEWGRPVHGDDALFERLSLEAFQSGLSWITILRKRPAFREAFAGFDPVAVARFDDSDVRRLLADAGIVRNRAKIEATISNARAATYRPPHPRRWRSQRSSRSAASASSDPPPPTPRCRPAAW